MENKRGASHKDDLHDMIRDFIPGYALMSKAQRCFFIVVCSLFATHDTQAVDALPWAVMGGVIVTLFTFVTMTVTVQSADEYEAQ